MGISAREKAAKTFCPIETRILFIAESPPSNEERYFYFVDVKTQDLLWIELMRVIYKDEFRSTTEERKRKRTG